MRNLVWCLVAAGVLIPASGVAQAMPDVGIASEIKSLEARIASLRRLEELRREEYMLREQLSAKAEPPLIIASTPPYAPSAPKDSTPSTASTASLEEKPTSEPQSPTLPAKEQKSSLNDFLAHFSVGAAVLLFDSPFVETAEFTGPERRVIVTEDRTHSVTPWLQANYVWDAAYTRGFWFSETTMPGIFAGVGMGPDGSFLDTFGVGAQLSFRRLAPGKSLNLGVGYYFTSKKELADGILDGRPLPAEFDQIKYRRRSAEGLLINLSFGFQ